MMKSGSSGGSSLVESKDTRSSSGGSSSSSISGSSSSSSGMGTATGTRTGTMERSDSLAKTLDFQPNRNPELDAKLDEILPVMDDVIAKAKAINKELVAQNEGLHALDAKVSAALNRVDNTTRTTTDTP